MRKFIVRTPAIALLILQFGLHEAFSASEDTVRVRILEQASPTEAHVFVKSGALEIRTVADGSRLAALGPDEDVRVERSGSRLFVVWADGQRETDAVRLENDLGRPIHLEIRTRSASVGSMAYHGALEVRPAATASHIMLLNYVPIEDYVASVVASEYPFNSIEGAKAQAVVVRTYALRTSGKFGPTYDHTDHVVSQVYSGSLAETDVSRRAAELTRGQILTYNGEPIEAVYSSTCGGHTASNEDVWDGSALPYLRGRPDPYDGDSPHNSWQTTADRETLLDILSREYGFRVAGLLLTDRASEGRVTTVRLLGNNPQNVRANAFRLAVNSHFGSQFLKSTMFDARIEGNDYIFEGRGFGHGVGLCQYGAHGQAAQGRPYRDILAFYYPGTRLESRTDPALVAELPQTDPTDFPAPPEDITDTEMVDPDEIDRSADEPAEPRSRPVARPRDEPRERPATRRVGW